MNDFDLDLDLDLDPDKNPNYISSQEIHACQDKIMLTDSQALDLRKQHNGRFV